MCVINYQALTIEITDWIRQQMDSANTSKLEVDISGGVDSALTAALAVQAAGADNVIGVYSACHSRPESKKLAQMVADSLAIKLVTINYEAVFDLLVVQAQQAFTQLDLDFPTATQAPVVFGSLRSTLRAPIGRFINRAFGGGLRLGTGNRDEDELIRFYQKGGDGEVDCSPIAGLFKSEVWALAEYLGIPESVIQQTPTPDLWGNGLEHTDEKELESMTGVALTYTRPNQVLGSIEWVSRENAKRGVINGKQATQTLRNLAEQYEYDSQQLAIIDSVRKLERQTRHKAEPPPYLSREQLEQSGLVQ